MNTRKTNKKRGAPRAQRADGRPTPATPPVGRALRAQRSPIVVILHAISILLKGNMFGLLRTGFVFCKSTKKQ